MIDPIMNTNELNDSENTASLDLSSINVIGMGLGGVDSSATASSSIGSSSQQYQPQANNLMKGNNSEYSHNSPGPILPPPPSSSATGSSSGSSNSQNLNNSSNQMLGKPANGPNGQKSASKKRKLDDLGLENISDSEGSSASSNPSGTFLYLNPFLNRDVNYR